MKVYIAYGWPEGPWHGQQFKQALIEAGYEVTDLVSEADIIIAHSAGCYLLPSTTKVGLILLIGLPYWPNKPLFKCTAGKIALEKKDAYWYKKSVMHLLYALIQPMRLYKVVKRFRAKFLPNWPNKVILVRNEQDTYMDEASSKLIAIHRNWQYIGVKGQHDDLWQNPKPYIELLNS